MIVSPIPYIEKFVYEEIISYSTEEQFRIFLFRLKTLCMVMNEVLLMNKRMLRVNKRMLLVGNRALLVDKRS